MCSGLAGGGSLTGQSNECGHEYDASPLYLKTNNQLFFICPTTQNLTLLIRFIGFCTFETKIFAVVSRFCQSYTLVFVEVFSHLVYQIRSLFISPQTVVTPLVNT